MDAFSMERSSSLAGYSTLVSEVLYGSAGIESIFRSRHCNLYSTFAMHCVKRVIKWVANKMAGGFFPIGVWSAGSDMLNGMPYAPPGSSHLHNLLCMLISLVV